MKDTIMAILAVLAILIGLPVLILWLRDRGGVLGATIKRGTGLVALLMGLTILGWVVFNIFVPTREFRASYKGVFQLTVPIAMAWFGWKWLTDAGPGIEELPMGFECEELKLSVAKAKATLPWFLEQVDRNVDGAFIKFPLKTPNGLTEHIWAYVHSFRDGSFNVSLANDPVDRDQGTLERINVPLDAVEDWQIMSPDGRIKGARSLIALFGHFESKGRKLTRKMREQKAQLMDAQPGPSTGSMSNSR